MGLIDSALQIGRSALLSYQSALQVVGNNISNAGSPDYTRQTPGLTPLVGSPLTEGMRPGSGVALTSLKRNLDEALENRLRAAIGDTESLDAQRRAIASVETLFDPLTGMKIDEQITSFFNQLNELQNAPTDLAVRDLATSAANQLATTLRDARARLAAIGDDLNDQISALVTQADSLATRVAELNVEIVKTESTGSPASALRDQRDAALRELSAIVEVAVRVQPDGAINVYVGNEPIIQGGLSRGLALSTRLDGEFKRTSVTFADTSSLVPLRGGQLDGLIKARDGDTLDRIADIDRLASAIIFEVNKVHADGQGLTGYSSLISLSAVTDTTAALSESGVLPFTPVNGSFYISITDDAGGGPTSYQVPVDLDGIGDDTTLESLVESINNSVRGVTASITVDNRLSLVADDGIRFTFGHDGTSQRQDTSSLLASMGVNGFFTGSSATDIAVAADIATQPALVAAAGVNRPGDGINAGRLAGVADVPSDLLAGASIFDSYVRIADRVAVQSAAARDGIEASTSVLQSLQAQKENISGVSLDEEAIQLVKYERAFQGAARFVSVVDRMTSELISLVS